VDGKTTLSPLSDEQGVSHSTVNTEDKEPAHKLTGTVDQQKHAVPLCGR